VLTYIEQKVQEVFSKLNELQESFERNSGIRDQPIEINELQIVQDMLSDSLASITDKEAIVQFLINRAQKSERDVKLLEVL